MSETLDINITLTPRMIDLIQRKMEHGQYDSPDEVIMEGLEALTDEDEVIEKWLRESVVPSIKQRIQNNEKCYTSEEVRAHVNARHEIAMAKQKQYN